MQITPGVGLGNIVFGMSELCIIQMLGKPDYSEDIQYNSVNNDKGRIMHFCRLQICLTFDRGDDYKLGTITILGHGHKLFGRDLYKLPKEDVKRLIACSTDEIPKDEDWSTDENDTLECLDHEGLAMLFWFENGYLERIECSYFFESDGETVIWPELVQQ